MLVPTPDAQSEQAQPQSAQPSPKTTMPGPAWLQRFVVRPDPAFEQLVSRHTARSRWATAGYLGLHLLPGVLAYLGLFYAREPLMALTGWSSRYVQFAILAGMALGWHIGLPFAMLRWVDGLSLRDSLRFLGLHALDMRGLLTVLPPVLLVSTVLTMPYVTFIHPRLFDWLNAFPALRIEAWHIYRIGYYDFPLPILIVVFIANFLGEEVYFRGYLLRKIGHLRGDWMLNSLLFQLYHVWQAPLNWAFAPLFVLIPFGLLVKWRRSLYGAILFHIFINLAWGEVLAWLSLGGA